jgi:hypothetical protein
MDPLDQRLTDAGESWRRSQRPPAYVRPFTPSRVARTWFGPLQAIVGIAAALAVLAGALVIAPHGPGAAQTPSPSTFLLTKPGTNSYEICMQALTTGYLVRDSTSGLGLGAEPGQSSVPVRWPYGYSARVDFGTLSLVDPAGRTVATEGEYLVLGGGGGPDRVWETCANSIQVAAAPPSSGTPVPPSILPDVTDQYADGLPRTFDGQHVYRPSDVVKDPPGGEFLLGGWDGGSLSVSCPLQKPGESIHCPMFEGAAEARGGDAVLPMSLGYTPWAGGPAFVVRARANPALACLSVPAGGCPGPSVTVVERLWAGDPSTIEVPSPNADASPTVWWSGHDDFGFCQPPAVFRLHGTITWIGPCMGVFFDRPTPITLTVGDRLDLHLLRQRSDGTPVYSVPGTTNGEVIDIDATTDPATFTYLAKSPGTASLITFGSCIAVDPSQPNGVAGQTNGPCPVFEVTVVATP